MKIQLMSLSEYRRDIVNSQTEFVDMAEKVIAHIDNQLRLTIINDLSLPFIVPLDKSIPVYILRYVQDLVERETDLRTGLDNDPEKPFYEFIIGGKFR